MQEDITRLSEELDKIEQAITEQERLRGVSPAAEVDARLGSLQKKKADLIRAKIAIAGQVTNSNLIIGHNNRAMENGTVIEQVGHLHIHQYGHPTSDKGSKEETGIVERRAPVIDLPNSGPFVRHSFRYDAYISYVEQEPDETWVWDTLIPRLEEAGLRVAVSGEVETAGVAKVVGIEQAMKQCKRIIVVLSPTYLADQMADFQNVLAQTLAIYEDSYRLLPVKIAQIDEAQLPMRLRMLSTINLIHPRRAAREFNRLVKGLQSPLPRRLAS